jgi:putative acetyltransferase
MTLSLRAPATRHSAGSGNGIGQNLVSQEVIRRYADADLDDVLDVWYEASVVAHSFLPAEFFVSERAQIADRWLPMARTFVYERDERVVGFLALIGNEVGALFVHPDHQRQGIGRALMDHARSLSPILELDVFEMNVIGRRFYAAYGFQPVGAHSDPETGHTQHRLHLS